MEIDEDKIREWAEAVEDMERKDGFKGDVSTRETIFENEDEGFEWGTTIGTFSVDENTITEMGSIGQFDASHLFTVYIHPDEGMTPHFHVFDKEGKDKKKSTDPGRHTCVEIRQNKYFKHGAYADSLDGKTRKALDRFMRGIRIRPKYSTDIWGYELHPHDKRMGRQQCGRRLRKLGRFRQH